MAAAAVRFSTQSLLRMRWTCLQIVPVHALRITPISLGHMFLVGQQREAASRIHTGRNASGHPHAQNRLIEQVNHGASFQSVAVAVPTLVLDFDLGTDPRVIR
jgi:hypothetical protein